MSELKRRVEKFWDESSCGEVYASGKDLNGYYQSHSVARYQLEPYIFDFAKFNEGKDRDVLEIGVGMGADHVKWAASLPRQLTGIDLTPRAIEHTKKRLAVYDLGSDLNVGDAENLNFEDGSFDIVYSWGVIHHSPDTPKAINEIYRVLKVGGIARVMVYHKYSLTGYMLWIKYALLKLKPFLSLEAIYRDHLESPGTKAYTVNEAKKMFNQFSACDIRVQLSFGDLLQGAVGQRHKSMALSLAKKIWPRCLIKKLFKNHGIMLLIEVKK